MVNENSGKGTQVPMNVDDMASYIDYLKSIARKWLKVWEREKVYEADPDPSRRKYFITAAFMYPNGPAHIGHARTYVIPDVIARFKRALGYDVLFPMGFHYTGTPILSTASKVASGDENFIKSMAAAFGIPEEEFRKLTEPLKLARYFHSISKDAMRFYGLSIDWRREFTTVDPEFKAFIRWQFSKLKEKGYLVKGSHPVGWCPKDEMPVGMHDTKDDVEPEIGEVTLIKFVDDSGKFYPTATLRPETVLGVTNIWVNPNVEYCICDVNVGRGTEKWFLACKAAWRLSFQLDLKVIERIPGKELVGRKVINPLTGREVEILPATFVSEGFGTGVVMSVPAHAPYDYAALRDYVIKYRGGEWGDLKPVPLIVVEGYSDVPAKDAIERRGVKSQEDTEKLEDATKEIYRAEHSKGTMREGLEKLVVKEVILGVRQFITKSINGVPVQEARERIKEYLRKNGYAYIAYELMNAPVYCRCGAEIVVKLLRNQWFLDYGNPEWKELARKLLARMRIVPEARRSEFVATIEWLKARACARSRGLGTELPWDKGWIIESLSDSTIYMAFYTVIHKIRKYGISDTQLTPEFWDYVMLGKGSIKEVSTKTGVSEDVLKELREEFNYWYPLDSRNSGKDLIPSHLTFFIFNHAAIYPPEKWPKQIVANGWVLVKGEKMSKSKGNVMILHGLVNTFSPDIVRLAMTLGAEVEADMNFTVELVDNTGSRLRKVETMIRDLYGKCDAEEEGIAERWIVSRFALHVRRAISELENVRVRAAGVRIFYLIPQDIEEYLRMVNKPSKTLKRIIEEWIKLMSIYTPFIAEELWHAIGKDTLVVRERWLSEDELRKMMHEDALLKVEYVRRLIRDVKEVLKVVGKGEGIVVYAVPKESYTHLFRVAEIISSGGKIGDVMRYVAKEMGVRGKEVPRIGKTLLELAVSMDPEVMNMLKKVGGIDEVGAINELRHYVERETGVKVVGIYRADDPEAPDMGGKKRQALPWKPGIYVTGAE